MHYLLTGPPPWLLQLELAKNKCTPERLEVWQRGVDTVRFNPSYKCEAMRSTLTDGHPEAPLLVHVGRLGAGVSQPTYMDSSSVVHLTIFRLPMICIHTLS